MFKIYFGTLTRLIDPFINCGNFDHLKHFFPSEKFSTKIFSK